MPPRGGNSRSGARPRRTAGSVPGSGVPEALASAHRATISTQQAFGNILSELARHPDIRRRLVTTSPDVAVSTNLGGWIQKVGVYSPENRTDYFGESHIPVAVKWKQGPQGQHLELGISENNLFLMLGALGVSGDLFGETLVPIGTLYDTFISRGLDALHYAIYNGGKFILVGTPSGISLSPEGGLHQSLMPPSFGIESPRITYFEPCFAQELEWILLDRVRRILEEPDAESLYLRLSTVPQPQDLFPGDASGTAAECAAGRLPADRPPRPARLSAGRERRQPVHLRRHGPAGRGSQQRPRRRRIVRQRHQRDQPRPAASRLGECRARPDERPIPRRTISNN